MTHNNAIRANVVTERIAWIRQMIRNISHLPLQDLNTFTSDFRNVAAAESYMRRALESLLDLGRHILAKGFSIVVTEYKEIDKKLEEEGIIDSESKILFRRIAGYRNRMVHFYNEISEEELYEICTQHISDIQSLSDTITSWLKQHPEKIDNSIDNHS